MLLMVGWFGEGGIIQVFFFFLSLYHLLTFPVFNSLMFLPGMFSIFFFFFFFLAKRF